MEVATIIIGSVLIALVAIQLLLVILSSLRSLKAQQAQVHHEHELMVERIESARAIRHKRIAAEQAWNGYRKFVVKRKVEEADRICSFYLEPHDRKPLPEFEPGQFLTFQFQVPGHGKPVIRCYSLSDCHATDCYRITVKHVPPPPKVPDAPPGVGSGFLHQSVNEGDILDVMAPRGHFTLNPSVSAPAVLIGGGIGITPLLCMANAVAKENSRREILLFYAVRNGREHAMKDHLRQLTANHPNIKVVICYSDPAEDDEPEEDYQHSGYITQELLEEYVDSPKAQFFVCGPPAMMESLTKQLLDWGVAKEDVHSEAFGPASIKARSAAAPAETPKTVQVNGTEIFFSRSGKRAPWDNQATNILEFAQANGVRIESACCAGSCGTCQVAVKSGKVVYDEEPEYQVESGCCLTCVGRPDGKIVIDA